jgi:hypothetical protein
MSEASASAVERGKAVQDDPQHAIAFDFPAVPEVTRIAEVHLPIAGQVLVQPGQIVVAGADLIGQVPHP